MPSTEACSLSQWILTAPFACIVIHIHSVESCKFMLFFFEIYSLKYMDLFGNICESMLEPKGFKIQVPCLFHWRPDGKIWVSMKDLAGRKTLKHSGYVENKGH